MRKKCRKGSLEDYRAYLKSRDMKPNTVEKYIRDIRKFLVFIQNDKLDHDAVVRYREYLLSRYKDTSTNSMLVALNGYLKYIGKKECRISLLKIQRQFFVDESRELTREEYNRLVKQADKEGNQRLSYIIQTIGSLGIGVSELSYITVESLSQKAVCINSKGKIRYILLTASLVKLLKAYCTQEKRVSGSIFVTRTGRPVDRRNIWSSMKALCRRAGVDESKVFPHNLRHLFARCFYEKEKDIVRLADYLGHSSVETTRRYTMTSQIEECRKTLEMGMVGEHCGHKHKNKRKKAL